MSLEKMRSALVEADVTLQESTWKKLEDLVEFAQEELGIERADQDRVFDEVMREFFESRIAVIEEFDEWKETREEDEE